MLVQVMTQVNESHFQYGFCLHNLHISSTLALQAFTDPAYTSSQLWAYLTMCMIYDDGFDLEIITVKGSGFMQYHTV